MFSQFWPKINIFPLHSLEVDRVGVGRPDVVVHGGVPDRREGAEPARLSRADLAHRVEGRLQQRRSLRWGRARRPLVRVGGPAKCSCNKSVFSA